MRPISCASRSSTSSDALVVGVGNAWAGDDAAGILVARALRGGLPPGTDLLEHEGEPTALIDAWANRRIAIVVDATAGAGTPGTVTSYDATSAELHSPFAGRSTHAFTVAQAIELARALGRMPARLFVVGIEGTSFAAGTDPGAAVAAAIEPAARKVLDLLGRGRS